MATSAKVNPDVLRWARERAGLSLADLAERVAKGRGERVQGWESGKDSPTFEQARKLANTLRVPFAYLFFSAIPELRDEETLPDFRTVGNRPAEISPDLRDVIADVTRKQHWLEEYREQVQADPVNFVGACDVDSEMRVAVECIEAALGPSESLRKQVDSTAAYVTKLVDQCELAGVLVVRSSIVGSNTRRVLDPDEFRGFAVADALAPAIFVNTADIDEAQAFTILHEIAHLAIGASGISSAPVTVPETPGPREEEFCNRVAAEFLVPSGEFLATWSPGSDLHSNIRNSSTRFRASQMVIARRALELGLITDSVYWPFVRERLNQWRARKEKQKNSPGAPPPAILIASRNGKRFANLVVSEARCGRLLYRDAAKILNVRPRHIDELAENGSV